jgi:hypothetical protein
MIIPFLIFTLILLIICLIYCLGLVSSGYVRLERERIAAERRASHAQNQADHWEGELKRTAKELHEMRVGKDRVLDAEVIG